MAEIQFKKAQNQVCCQQLEIDRAANYGSDENATNKVRKGRDGEFWQADPSEKLPNVYTLFPLPITHCSHRDVKLWAVCPTDYSAETLHLSLSAFYVRRETFISVLL